MFSPRFSNLACLKAQADFYASVADLEFKTWRDLRDLRDALRRHADLAKRPDARSLHLCANPRASPACAEGTARPGKERWSAEGMGEDGEAGSPSL